MSTPAPDTYQMSVDEIANAVRRKIVAAEPGFADKKGRDELRLELMRAAKANGSLGDFITNEMLSHQERVGVLLLGRGETIDESRG